MQAERRYTNGPLAHLSAEELDALPDGTVRCFDLGGLSMSFFKGPEGRWLPIHRRRGVPAHVLARHMSAERFDAPRG